MGIVFCLPLAPGLFALAVDLPVNLNEAYAGLVLPASAYVLMGKAGAHLLACLPPSPTRPPHAPTVLIAQHMQGKQVHACSSAEPACCALPCKLCSVPHAGHGGAKGMQHSLCNSESMQYRAGAIMIIVICFMAVTSSGASEMLAVSSLFTFDIYRRYINPKARESTLCFWRG